MRIAIMQPYFLPYLGYFQLIDAVDEFVVYDTIQFSKKGWINRNQFLRNGQGTLFSIPLRKDSDFLDVRDRSVSEAFEPSKLCNQISGAYRGAPEFKQVMPLLEELAHFRAANLFDFVFHSISETCAFMGMETKLSVSSRVEEGSSDLRGEDRVIDICKRCQATEYLNPPGGKALYDARRFSEHGLELRFLEPQLSEYPQFGATFVPSLSILDVLMFNDLDRIKETMLKEYRLVDG